MSIYLYLDQPSPYEIRRQNRIKCIESRLDSLGLRGITSKKTSTSKPKKRKAIDLNTPKRRSPRLRATDDKQPLKPLNKKRRSSNDSSSLSDTKKPDSVDDSWEQSFQQTKEYIEKFGCESDPSPDEYPDLSRWYTEQRRREAENTLYPTNKKSRLANIGFKFYGAAGTKCSHKGCTNQVQSRGVCKQHGAPKKTCSHKGCTNQVQSSGVCTKHGANRKTCRHDGCTKHIQKDGLCRQHGATAKLCKHEGCTNQVQNSGLCKAHGAIVKKKKKK